MKALKKWYKRTLQHFRDVYTEEHKPPLSRAERRRLERLAKKGKK